MEALRLSLYNHRMEVVDMKKLKYVMIFILVINTALYSAAYEDICTVRAKGMGEALEAVSVGIDSIRYNPAGLAYLRSLQIYNSFGKPAVGFDDESSIYSLDFGVSVPFSNKPYLIFLTYLFKGLTLGNEMKIVRDGSFSFMFHQFSVSDLAYERLFTFNISKSLNNLFEGANMAVGVNLHIYNRGFYHTEDTRIHPDPNLVNSATGFGLDVGATYDFSKYIRLGFVIENLIEPNISFFKDSSEYVNRKMKAGISWRLGDISFFDKKIMFQNLLVSGGFVQISRDSEDIRKPEFLYKAGIEFWEWQEKIGIRFGFITKINTFTSGFSFKYKFKNLHTIIIHYAFNFPTISKNYKHYWGLNYEFDFPDYLFDYRTQKDIEEENQWIQNNYRKGLVIKKYKTLPNDNLYNVSLINYGTADRVELLKKHNKIEDVKELPDIIEIPYDAKYFELYKIQAGDTLESIAEKFYGDKSKTGEIRRFNTIEFSRLRAGRILVIPKQTTKSETKRRIKSRKIKTKTKAKNKTKSKTK